MADNLTITQGTGTTVATDDVGGVHYQYVKLANGTLDSSQVAIVNASGELTVKATDSDGLLTTIDADTSALAAAVNGNSNVGVVLCNTGGTEVDPIGPSTFFHNRNWTTDAAEVQVKATAGTLYFIHATNMTASVAYLQVFNATAASVTLGTTAADMVFPIPTLATTNGSGWAMSFGAGGITMGTAISVAVTTTATGSTMVADDGTFLTLGYS